MEPNKDYILRLLEERKWSHNKFAMQAKVSKSTISTIQKIENNEYCDDINTWLLIADALELSRNKIIRMLLIDDGNSYGDKIYSELLGQLIVTRKAIDNLSPSDLELDNKQKELQKLDLMIRTFGDTHPHNHGKVDKLLKWKDPDPEDLFSVPILATLSADSLIDQDNVIGHESVSIKSHGYGLYFGLRAPDDSMNASHINAGDTVIVKEQADVKNGEIAIVMIGSQHPIIRRVYRDNNKFTLLPSNPNYPPEIVDAEVFDPDISANTDGMIDTVTNVRILGKVVKVIISFV